MLMYVQSSIEYMHLISYLLFLLVSELYFSFKMLDSFNRGSPSIFTNIYVCIANWTVIDAFVPQQLHSFQNI